MAPVDWKKKQEETLKKLLEISSMDDDKIEMIILEKRYSICRMTRSGKLPWMRKSVLGPPL